MFEFYSDTMEVRISDAPDNPTVGMSFGLSMDGPGYKQRLLMSETNAKKLALLLKKLLKKREDILGHPIVLDASFYQKAEIAPEDF